MPGGKSSSGQRALPDLVARIRLDSSGVDSALMSLVHSFGKADLAIAGLAAGIGLLIVGGKSMYDTWQKIDGAEQGLAQSVAAHNTELADQTKKSGELAKAQGELAKAKHALNLYDLEHHSTADKTSQDLKGHATDLKKAEQASRSLQSAQSSLDAWDLSHTGHVLNAAQLKQREVKLRDVAQAQSALSAAQGEAATMDTRTTKGHQLTALELAHRQDLLDKVAEAQANVNDETAASTAAGRGQKLTLEQVQKSADGLIGSNRRYIKDQAEVYDGYAKLIRGGLSLKETQRVMNDAIDLSALKHISLAEATDILSNAEHGRMRGLIDLGITTKELTDKDGNLLGGQRAVNAAMAELDKKVAHGRDTVSQMDQKTNQLNNDWQDLSKKGGPVIQTLLDGIVQGLIDVYDWFDSVGKNDALWGAISDRLMHMAQWIKQWIIDPLKEANSWLQSLGTPQDKNTAGVSKMNPYGNSSKPPAAPSKGSGSFGHKGGLASGGPVMPYGTYRVGEDDEELLIMGARGGYVVPTGSGSGSGRRGGNVTVNVYAQTNADPREIATEIGWELRKLRRTG